MLGGPVTSKKDEKNILEGIVGIGSVECSKSDTPSKLLIL